MKTVLAVVLLFLGLGSFASSSLEWESIIGASPGENVKRQIAPVLREVATTLQDRILSNVVTDPEDQLEFHAFMSELVATKIPDPDTNIDCGECRLYLGSLMALLDQGLGFEDIKPLAVEICFEVTANNNWRGDIICDGIIDNYGPHVVYVLNATELNAYGVCQKYRLCPESASEASTINIDFFRPSEAAEALVAPKKRKLDEMLKVVQLTDIHVDELYKDGAPTECNLPICCRDQWNGTGSASPWGEANCHMPPRVIYKLLDSLAELSPDFAVYTGDNAPSSMWDETFASQMQTGMFVTSAFRDHLPGVPVFPCVGNHDMYPTNLYYGPLNYTRDFNAAYLEAWRDLAGFGLEDEEGLLTAGYFQKLLSPGLRLLSYNSNYGYTDNFYGILNEGEEAFVKMLAFMEDTFDLARGNGEKVFLIGHHPIGSRGYFKYYDTVIDDIITRNGDVIIIQPLGHTHSNNLVLTLDASNGEPRSVWLTTAAVVGVIESATARMFYLDPDTYEAVDYDTYHLDLEEAMRKEEEEPVFKLMYRASEEYGLSDLSAQSMFELTQRFEQDDVLWEQYRYNSVARRYVPGACLGECRDNQLCSIRSTTYEKQQECIAQAASRRN